MDIPKKLDELIRQDKKLSSAVDGAIAQYEKILGNQNTGLFFFPEYTDHGPDHIAGVLETATALVTDSVWEKNLLTPEDASVLVVAALLHDSAMMLTPDAFKHILEPSWKIHQFDKEKTWLSLFDDYYAESRRWDEKKLYRILGDQENPDNNKNLFDTIKHINDCSISEEWSLRYRKFLGEFIRRHHARLAHEIAVFGFPKYGKSCGKDITLSDALLDISGFVARSHNMQLRGTFDYLKDVWGGNVSCYKTHPIYLMVLLRIADYLQIDSSRISEGFRSIQRLRSPISNHEWDAHLAIEYIDQHQDDIESILVFAIPENAKIFLKLKNLLAGLQSELDSSWAVMGELYSKDSILRDLGITLRRVRSNIDNVQDYIINRNPSYYPMHAAFDVEGASLLKLLIKPLYGDSPEIGVRELLQNSLDAVREMRKYCELHKIDIKTLPFPEQEADVLISIDKHNDGNHYLTITDKGIGMTAETVRDYFLKAGASFRNSDYWQKEFIKDDNSTVLRSGRFGIGALATFLLGDRMEVKTRHIDAKPEEGVVYYASIEDEDIELHRAKLSVIGTEIKIPLSESTFEEFDHVGGSDFDSQKDLMWDWFVLNDPKVERKIDNVSLIQSTIFPLSINGLTKDDWTKIVPGGFNEVHWTYNDLSKGIGARYLGEKFLVCNGIVVSGPIVDSGSTYWQTTAKHPFSNPSISVFDENGNLPLNLLRDGLDNHELPFADDIVESLTKDLCAFLLIYSPIKYGNYSNLFSFPFIPSSLGYLNSLDHILYSKDGIMLLHHYHLIRNNINKIISASVPFTIKKNIFPKDGVLFCFNEGKNLIHDFITHSRVFLETGNITSIAGAKLILSNSVDIFHYTYRHKSEDAFKQRYFSEQSTAYEYGSTDKLLDNFEGIIKMLEGKNPNSEITILELFLDHSQTKNTPSPFTKVWDEIMEGNPIIPYSMKERRKKFAKAFEVLQDYIEAWEHPVPGGWREKCVPKK